MDIMGIAISFIELIGSFIIYNIFINNKAFYMIIEKIVFAVVTSTIYMFFSSYYKGDALIVLMGVLFLSSIFISALEKKDTILTFIELIVSIIVVCILELIATSIIHLIIGENDATATTYLILLAIIINMLILIIGKSCLNKKINIEKLLSKYRVINIIVVNLFLFFLIIKVLLGNGLMNTDIIVQITILTLILIGMSCYFYIYLYNTLNKKKKKEIKKSFNPLINDLMGKLKANEHEYRNHLNTIWSIAQVSSEGEVKEKLKEYISNIIDDTEEFSMLINVENTIIKAVLYNKGQRAEKLGITYKYNIMSDLKEISLDNAELTVVLSNLLNNAIEATSMIKKKEIEVTIEEDSKKYVINVKNRTEGVKLEDLTNIFKMGYTTKGEGRGYGLYNVKEIVDKYRGKIEMSLEEDILHMKLIFNK